MSDRARIAFGAGLAWAGFLACAVVSSCSIDHRSDEIACTNNNDCPDGTCKDGVCVSTNPPDGAQPDGNHQPDASLCPAPCTSCDLGQKTCRIDCALTNACNSGFSCPTGFACDIQCTTPSSCRSGIDCKQADSCKVNCSGQGSCRGLQCGLGVCSANCSGKESCSNMACNGSCMCDFTCGDAASCSNMVCHIGQTGQQCRTLSGGCSSQFFGCSTPCPP